MNVDPTKKVLIYVPVEGSPEVHSVPMDFSRASVRSMAADMLGTEQALEHEIGVDDMGVMRCYVYTLNQDGELEHNTTVCDTLVMAMETLTYFEGNCVVALEPSYLEASL